MIILDMGGGAGVEGFGQARSAGSIKGVPKARRS
jgi:hypothetical protein